MSEIEEGRQWWKWWIRYVIVPLLVGSVGLIAYIKQPNVSQNAEAPATVIFLVVPPRGGGPSSKGVITGRVRGLSDPINYRIVLYALTDRWYVQPTSNEPLTLIRDDGSWESTTHLGSDYAALLVASSFDPPESPDAIPGGDAVIAFRTVRATVNP